MLVVFALQALIFCQWCAWDSDGFQLWHRCSRWSAPAGRLLTSRHFQKQPPPPHRTRLFIRPDWHRQAEEDDMVIVHFEEGDDMVETVRNAIARANMNVSVDDFLLPTGPRSKDHTVQRRLDNYNDIDDSSTNEEGSQFGLWSLHDLSNMYYFSMSYLGDYICSLGVNPPINPDKPIGEYLSGMQLYSLAKALNTLSPHEVNEEFADGASSIVALAEELNVDVSFLVNTVFKEMGTKIPLPFGVHTVLHSSLVAKIVDDVEGRRKFSDSESIPVFNEQFDVTSDAINAEDDDDEEDEEDVTDEIKDVEFTNEEDVDVNSSYDRTDRIDDDDEDDGHQVDEISDTDEDETEETE
jgi:hypothetical protein